MRFDKQLRLLSSGDFQRVKASGRRLKGHFLYLDVASARGAASRLGISASRKFGDAPERNRFKRIAREAFRLGHKAWPSADLHVVPRQSAKSASSRDIQNELLRLLGGTQS